jgi:hypothetical protein
MWHFLKRPKVDRCNITMLATFAPLVKAILQHPHLCFFRVRYNAMPTGSAVQCPFCSASLRYHVLNSFLNAGGKIALLPPSFCFVIPK